MVNRITAKLADYANDPQSHLTITKSTGNKAFCAGGDVVALAIANGKGPAGKLASVRFFYDVYGLYHLIGAFPKPYICFMNGISMGGGVGLSVHGSFRVVTENTLFAMPETDIGFYPDVGGSFFLSRLEGELGKYLGLTSARLKGYDVVAAGVGTHYIPEERLQEVEAKLISLQLEDPTSQEAYDKVNQVLNEYSSDAPQGKDYQFEITGENRKLVDCAFAKGSVEEVLQELHNSGTPFAQAAIQAINTRSPTSVKVALAVLEQAKSLGIRGCLDEEYRISENFMYGGQFTEGVMAKLVEKRAPKWTPETLSQVTEDIVQGYMTHRTNSESSDIEYFFGSVDFKRYPHKYGLPDEHDVELVITEKNGGKVSEKEVLEKFENDNTVRKVEVRRKVSEIIARKTTTDNNGNLKWEY